MQTMLSQMNQNAAASLAQAAAELGDKATWSPLDKGRSALNQVQECLTITKLGTAIFQTGVVPAMDQAAFAATQSTYDTPEKACAGLTEAVAEFAAAIEATPDEKMGHVVRLPFGGGVDKSLSEVAMLVYWNTVYHEGQINYIQTLCAPDA